MSKKDFFSNKLHLPEIYPFFKEQTLDLEVGDYKYTHEKFSQVFAGNSPSHGPYARFIKYLGNPDEADLFKIITYVGYNENNELLIGTGRFGPLNFITVHSYDEETNRFTLLEQTNSQTIKPTETQPEIYAQLSKQIENDITVSTQNITALTQNVEATP